MTCKVNADTTNGLKLTSDTSGEIDLQTNGTTKVHMDSSGNVGIGTSSPASELAIQATGAGARFEVETTGSTGFRIYQDDSDGYTRLQTYDTTGTTYGKGMSFWTAPSGGATAERMRINNNVLMIGATSFPGHVPKTNGLRLYLEGGTGAGRDCFIINGDGGSGDEPFILFNRNDGTEKCKIFGDGDLVNANKPGS